MANPIGAKEISQLLAENASALEMYASQWTRAPEDCVQDAFVELASQAASPNRPVAWLYRVVRNRAINAARSDARRRRHERHAREPSQLAPDASTIAADDYQQLSEKLESLADDQRELIVLRIWSGLTWQQISEVTGISSSSVQRRYVAALNRLKELMETPCLDHSKTTRN